MKAEILSIGTEILLGEITDTNASYIASQLPGLGIDLYWVSQVGDNRGRVGEVLRRAWGRSDLILTTGGLGPTDDDLTRECISDLLGEKMALAPELERELREMFSRRRFPMPERNLKQATLIPSAQAIPNPRGTAPGWWVEKDGHLIIAMPGPPTEMQRMWDKEIVARLKARHSDTIILTRTLKTFGIGEGNVDEMISALTPSANPTVATYAKPDGVYVRMAAKAPREAEARRMVAGLEEKLRAILGDAIWGVDEENLAEVVGNLLKARKQTVAVMESCTGGLLASTITDNPGSSGYFKGGVVAYTNEVKVAWGVDAALIAAHGAVSAPVAEAMAQAVRERLGASYGIGVTGVAGPDPLEGKAPGTVFIAVADERGAQVFPATYPPRRPEVKFRATIGALFHLRRLLLGGG